MCHANHLYQHISSHIYYSSWRYIYINICHIRSYFRTYVRLQCAFAPSSSIAQIGFAFDSNHTQIVCTLADWMRRHGTVSALSMYICMCELLLPVDMML